MVRRDPILAAGKAGEENETRFTPRNDIEPSMGELNVSTISGTVDHMTNICVDDGAERNVAGHCRLHRPERVPILPKKAVAARRSGVRRSGAAEID